MLTFRQIIDLWPSLEALADDAGHNVVAVRKWRQRDRIPPEYWQNLVAGARIRGIEGVTTDALATAAAGDLADTRPCDTEAPDAAA